MSAPAEGADLRRDRRQDIYREERPWGDFCQFACNESVTVKIITVQPGQRLSLQRHARRAELWEVLDVALDVTVDDNTWSAQPGERIWVPLGAIHRMANSGDRAGRILEVGFGEFDEADIERLEDDYSRS